MAKKQVVKAKKATAKLPAARGKSGKNKLQLKPPGAKRKLKHLSDQGVSQIQMLLDLSPDAVVVIDPHTQNGLWPIIDCNSAACQMNGYQREELDREVY